MKVFKKIVLPFLLLAILITATSCSLFHQHDWKDYLIKAPTCTEVGILKSLCIECGEATYSEISMSEHNYVDGVCTECGALGSSIESLQTITLPPNSDNQGVWSFEKIYETASSLIFNGTYSEFMNSLSGLSLKNARVDSLNLLHMNARAILNDGSVRELPLILTFTSVSPINPSATIGVILRADIEDGELILTYTTGTEISVGKLNPDVGTRITGFGVNKNKELVIYYSNGMISFAGTFAS